MSACAIISLCPDERVQAIDLAEPAVVHPDNQIGKRFPVSSNGHDGSALVGQDNGGDHPRIEISQDLSGRFGGQLPGPEEGLLNPVWPGEAEALLPQGEAEKWASGREQPDLYRGGTQIQGEQQITLCSHGDAYTPSPCQDG